MKKGLDDIPLKVYFRHATSGLHWPIFVALVYTFTGIKIETFAVAQPEKTQSKSLIWAEDPAVKQLLDVVALILAEEYVQTVRQHPDAFSRNGGPT